MDSRGTRKAFLLAAAAIIAAVASTPTSALHDNPNEGAWLGIYIQDLNSSLRAQFAGAPETAGVLVSSVMNGSPAEAAGLRSGDILLELDGRPLESREHLRQEVSRTRPDTEVSLLILRDGERLTMTAKVAAKPEGGGPPRRERAEGWWGREVPWSRWFLMDHEGGLGAKMTDLNPSLAEYIQGTGGSGVLLLEVCSDSPAESAGLRPGDVIVSANGHDVADLGDLRHELRRVEADISNLEFVRKGVRQQTQIGLQTGPECWKSPHGSFFRLEPGAPGSRLIPEDENSTADQFGLGEMFRAVPEALTELWQEPPATASDTELRADLDKLRAHTDELEATISGLRQEIEDLKSQVAKPSP